MKFQNQPSLLPQPEYDGYAWAMVIDTSTCIGCNACVVACQAENNVPVVGPTEVLAGRDMHWLRIDSYVVEPDQTPGFQPVPCMHCEQAPCEPVCPVAASVHDGEGLNVQVYNRCIGTRFCQGVLPVQGAPIQLVRLCRRPGIRRPRAELGEGLAQSRRHRAGARRHGEVHLLRPAHQPGAPRGREGGSPDRDG